MLGPAAIGLTLHFQTEPQASLPDPGLIPVAGVLLCCLPEVVGKQWGSPPTWMPGLEPIIIWNLTPQGTALPSVL